MARRSLSFARFRLAVLCPARRLLQRRAELLEWISHACAQSLTRLRIPPPMSEPSRGLLDTSVVVDHDVIDSEVLPDESAISAVTLAELAAGPHATDDDGERARRQDRLQWAAATWDPLPFDADAARAYARVFAATRAAGRSSRTRVADLLIAATAASNGLRLYTRNPIDFLGLDHILTVVKV
jgi:predicted nucleic acid-binding protein